MELCENCEKHVDDCECEFCQLCHETKNDCQCYELDCGCMDMNVNSICEHCYVCSEHCECEFAECGCNLCDVHDVCGYCNSCVECCECEEDNPPENEQCTLTLPEILENTEIGYGLRELGIKLSSLGMVFGHNLWCCQGCATSHLSQIDQDYI